MTALRSYLELLRPANVVTAVADVLAGFAVAGTSRIDGLPWLMAAAACLYAGGIVLNDYFDRDLDARERPERPIPSGRVRADRAAALGVGLLVGGVAAASAVSATAAGVAGVLAAAVVLYDSWTKRRAFVGPLNMGLCRGLNLLLGMAAVPAALAGRWPLALVPFLYIVGVTTLSRGEVHGGDRSRAGFALVSLIIVLGGLVVLVLGPGGGSLIGLALTALLGVRVLPPFARAVSDLRPVAIRTAVRTGVLSLVLLDAVIGAVYGGVLFVAAILATAVLATGLARLFSVT